MPMIKNKKIEEKGISLISLVVATTVLVILANVIIYNAKDNLKIGNLKEMQNDISNLRDKVSSYYAQNGKIPASLSYTNEEAIEKIRQAGVISQKVDIGEFKVIDLSAIDNLTLNRGEDYKKIKAIENPSMEQVNQYTDLYIINETSHNVFYVEGIKLDNEVFYTDYTAEEIDKASVDLRYIEGVKIPDGFYYVGGTKTLGTIFIKKNDNSETYRWITSEEIITDIPEGIQIENRQKEDFIKSVNSYHGYYKNENGNNVIYLDIEKWSPIYDEEGIYKDKNADTAYIPQGFQVSEVPNQNTIDDGLVIRDGQENEWVWIEVPKSIYKTAESSEDYEKIEKDMQEYTKAYREEEYVDQWYSQEQHGLTETEYNNLKNSMLKSIYEKGGFYIGRYEVGIETARTQASETLSPAVLKQDAYPYNFVTCKQAQQVAQGLETGDKTSSLMYGIQWDLVLKFIEEKGKKLGDTNFQRQAKIKKTTYDFVSSDWGNYSNANFTITRGKYSADQGKTYKEVGEEEYTKPTDTEVLLTTGATQRNSVLNIFDLAGNVWEWTLEYTLLTSHPCADYGGSYNYSGSDYPVSFRRNQYGIWEWKQYRTSTSFMVVLKCLFFIFIGRQNRKKKM